jgi:hypothetical protein
MFGSSRDPIASSAFFAGGDVTDVGIYPHDDPQTIAHGVNVANHRVSLLDETEQQRF